MSCNVGALIIRIGFWGVYSAIHIIRSPKNTIGNYFGFYIRQCRPHGFQGFRMVLWLSGLDVEELLSP